VAKFYLAREIIEGRKIDARHVATVARSLGYSGSISKLLLAADAEAAEQVNILRTIADDPKIRKSLERTGLALHNERAIERARQASIQFSRENEGRIEVIAAQIEYSERHQGKFPTAIQLLDFAKEMAKPLSDNAMRLICAAALEQKEKAERIKSFFSPISWLRGIRQFFHDIERKTRPVESNERSHNG
jgi:hypothetical protein